MFGAKLLFGILRELETLMSQSKIKIVLLMIPEKLYLMKRARLSKVSES